MTDIVRQDKLAGERSEPCSSVLSGAPIEKHPTPSGVFLFLLVTAPNLSNPQGFDGFAQKFFLSFFEKSQFITFQKHFSNKKGKSLV